MQAPSVSPFQTPTATAAASASAANGKEDDKNSALSAVDFQNFLTLLTAQLRNQDPLDPADSTEFVAQLAQFSSVEQLVVANNKLDSISSAIVADGIEKYAGWIGKQAEATSAPAYFDGEPLQYRLSGASDASRVETVITNQSGKEVARFASQNSGAVQTWDGLVSGAPAPTGAYAVTAMYYGSNNEVIGEEIANTFGNVREVRFSGDTPAIVLTGGVEIKPSQIAGLGLKDEL